MCVRVFQIALGTMSLVSPRHHVLFVFQPRREELISFSVTYIYIYILFSFVLHLFSVPYCFTQLHEHIQTHTHIYIYIYIPENYSLAYLPRP